ncbi:hypothetical protein [Neobacillus sp. FSL H8-0543]|uniref:SGNH/GDSL hydrolase family protein n=1 Tax=Neobacillus sp. FSL H8-0543 TaxID=2954672 RepID=UPI0031584294
MMKNIFTVVLGIACLVVLYLGNSYWSQQNQASVKANNSSEEKEVEKSETKVTDEPDVLAYTKNWPTAAIDRFEQTVKEETTFKMLFVGSPAIEDTYEVVKEKMLKSFGEKNLQLAMKTYTTTTTPPTTKGWIEDNKQEEIIAEEADLIVLEPFLLLANGHATIDVTLDRLTLLMEDIQAANPETIFMIQPSYPLLTATIYPNQVAELKAYAEENQITYLDHWTVWPEQGTQELSDSLLPDQSGPSEIGIKLWSDFLLNYFISDESESI